MTSSGSNNLIEYKLGDGNDTIYNFSSTNSLKIDNVDYSVGISGDNLILSVDTASITIVDATRFSDINIIGKVDPAKADTSLVGDSNASLVTADSKIKNIIAFGRKKAVNIVGNDLNNSLIGGNGADSISGLAGNDELYGNAGNDTLLGGAGNDNLTGGKGNDLFVYTSGNDVITDYGTGSNKIYLSGKKIDDVDIIDNNVVLKIDGGSLTINDGYKVKNNDKVTNTNRTVTFLEEKETASKDKAKKTLTSKSYFFEDNMILNHSKTEVTLTAATTTFDSSAKLYSKIKSVNAQAVSSAVSIMGNGKTNKIYASNNGSTLNGGKGNDTLWGGDGKDIFIYENKSGNKVIDNYGEDDIISLGSGAEILNATLRKADVVFKIGKKKITVKDSSSKAITFDENGTVKTYSNGIIKSGTSATVTSAYPAKNKIELESDLSALDASPITKGLKISGNNSGDTILGSTKKDTINGGNGADSLVGDKGNDQIRGGAGNDTLWGGAGNDSLWGDDGADTFVYKKGDGKDVIFNFDSNDLLQITGSVNAYYNAKKDEISINVGSTSNAITLKNFGSTTQFKINNDTWTLSDNKLKK